MDESARRAVLDRYAAMIRALVRGRKVVFAGHHLAGLAPWIAGVLADGAEGCFVLACAVGTGPLPDDSVGRFVLGATGATPSDEVRAVNLALRNLPPGAIEALDEFDPAGDALVLCPPYLDARDVAGRAVFGARRPEWVALEDKTVADALFDRAGVDRPPSRVVPPTLDALLDAAHELDRGDGTVWSGDVRDGFHGGGDLVRWVRSENERQSFVGWFAERCDGVRIAPFLEGVPCSIHGFVCDDGVAVFRPMEMLILRRPDDHPDRARFVYAGMASLWDPQPEDRAAMRTVARRVGECLGDEVAYRGAFTVDGIMTVDGFLPTEVNPRYGGALGYAFASLPRLGLPVLHVIAAAGEGHEIRASELEVLVTDAGDATRWGSSNMFLSTPRADTSVHEVPGIGSTTIGPGVAGTLARLVPDVGAIEPGSSFAPLAVAAFAHAERELGLPVGPLVAARPVR